MSEIITNKLTGKTAAGNVTITSEGGSATMQLQQGVLKVWCAWDQDAVSSVYDSFNVSSITDVNTQTNQVSYSNSMSIAAGQAVTASFNANSAGLDNYSSSYYMVYRPRTDSIYIVSQSNQNAHYNCMHTAGDLA